jgi:hypothetical protein
MSKRIQKRMTKAFNTTGAPVKGVGGAVVGSGGTPPTEAGDAGSNYSVAVDVRGLDSISIHMGITGGTSATATLQATNDPTGAAGYANLMYREQSGGAYAATALTLVPAGANRSFFLDPADAPSFIRLSVSANTGAVVITTDVLGNI